MCISLSLHLPEDTGLHSQQSSREIKRALVLHPGEKKKSRWAGSSLYLTSEFLKSGCITHEESNMYKKHNSIKGEEK